MSSPFHRLLSFFATRSSPKSRTITFLDSLRGDLSLGLNFPIALFLAVTRHLVFGNTGSYNMTINVPSVKTSRVLLGGPEEFDIDESKRYGLRELISVTSGAGLSTRLDAIGCWGLVARRDGTISGKEIRAYQRGDVMELVAHRRRGRDDILPFWRGGPIMLVLPVLALNPSADRYSVDGHSWMVKRLFDVDVYRKDNDLKLM